MAFPDRLTQVAERATRLGGSLDGASAAKYALVVPFLEALGYDPRDPSAVVPAFSAGSARVDYALCPDGTPAVLLTCHPPGADLAAAPSGPLSRAMRTTELPLAAGTDGTRYWFFARGTDGLDDSPFFTVRLDDYDQRDVDVLRALRRDAFAPDAMVRRASRSAAPSVRDEEAEAVVHHLAAAVRAFADASGATQDRLRPVVQAVARHLIDGAPSRPLASNADDMAASARPLLRRFDALTGTDAPSPSGDAEDPDDPDAPDGLVEAVTRRLRATGAEAPASAPSTERLVRRIKDRLSS